MGGEMSARDLPGVEGRSPVTGRQYTPDDLTAWLEQLLARRLEEAGRKLEEATELEEMLTELVFWQPPLTDDEMEAAA